MFTRLHKWYDQVREPWRVLLALLGAALVIVPWEVAVQWGPSLPSWVTFTLIALVLAGLALASSRVHYMYTDTK